MYAKLFESILRSSIWSEDLPTRVLWISMLAAADREGYVFGSVTGIARTANVTVEAAQESFEKLMAPDPDSANPDFDGRRVEAIPGGWRLLNYRRYREIERQEDRRQAWRDKKKAQRIRRRLIGGQGGTVPQMSPSEGTVPQMSPSEAEAESEAEALPGIYGTSNDVHKPLPASPKPAPKTRERFVPPAVEEVAEFIEDQIKRGFRDYGKVNPRRFVAHYDSNGWKVGRNPMKNWKAAVATWAAKENE